MKLNRKILSLVFVALVLAGTIGACSGERAPLSPLVTPPAISLDLTGDVCPSIEVQAGMQIAWTNQDAIDRTIWFERKDENGVVTESGGIDLLQPGTTFSTAFMEPGQYTYYCSKERTAFGTITVLP